MANEDLEDLTNLVIRIGDHLVREAARLFKTKGITPAQFNVLHLLHIRGDGLRPSELSELLVVDPASATYLMDQMEKRGWILRTDDPGDRRAYRIVRTKAGREKHTEVQPLYEKGLAELSRRVGRAGEVKVALSLLALLPGAVTASTEALLVEAGGKPIRARITKTRTARKL